MALQRKNRARGQDVEFGRTPKANPSLAPSSSSRTLSTIIGLAALVLVAFFFLVGPEGNTSSKYAVVLDAGSTGSRVHVYEFKHENGANMRVHDELFVQLKPGLSSFAGRPADGAASLKPLMDKALARIPATHHASTPVMLGATAGLRMLPGSQSDDLLEASRTFLKTYPFILSGDESVQIMSGENEGKFAWLAVNMLMKKLGNVPEKTVGVIDLGGGSVQMMRALPTPAAASAPGGYISNAAWQSSSYDLYVHSFLGYGLMAGRKAVLKQQGANHACMPKGVVDSYTYNKETVDASGGQGSSFTECLAKASAALNLNKPCGATSGCAFNGAWRGTGETDFVLLSYLYERVEQAGAGVYEPNEGPGTVSMPELRLAATRICNMDLRKLESFTDSDPIHPEDPAFFCLDLAYIYALLTEGFGINSQVSMAKKFEENDVQFEAAWALGAALEDL